MANKRIIDLIEKQELENGDYFVVDNSEMGTRKIDGKKLSKDYVTPQMYGAIADGVTDDTEAIQNAIDSNPNKVVFFPDGVYLISEPILTPCYHTNTVNLVLSNYAIIQADDEVWTDGDYMIQLGATEPENNPYANGSLFGLTGGIIDCNRVANGVSIDNGRHIFIQNTDIKHVKSIGLYIKKSSLLNSSDSDIFHVNIQGTKNPDSIGVLIDGNDNTLSNMRVNGFHIGIRLNSGGNLLSDIHPLFLIPDDNSNYSTSIGFDIGASDNFLNQCYADGFSIAFQTKNNAKAIVDNCYAYWYSSSPELSPQTAIKALNWFNSTFTNFTVVFRNGTTNTMLEVTNNDAGTGEIKNLRVTKSYLTNPTSDDYLKFIDDTGWISLVDYVANGFTARGTNIDDWYTPAYRVINGLVYFKGYVYCTTAQSSNIATILSDIPTRIRPKEEATSAGIRGAMIPYKILYNSKIIIVRESNTIGVQNPSDGYSLKPFGGYPADNR